MKKPFYMVFLEGGFAPKFKHETLEQAETEAKRLTLIHKAKSYVLCTIKSIEHVPDFTINDLRPDNDPLPF